MCFMIGFVVALSSVLSGDTAMEAAEALAVVVRGLRRMRGLSQEDLGSIGRSHISQIEQGSINIRLDVLGRLASVLDLDTPALLLMVAAVQNGESFRDGIRRVSKQLSKVGEREFSLEVKALLAEAGKPTGRPARPDAAAKAVEARRLREAGMPVTRIAAHLGLSEATIRRYLKADPT
ncbi:transcriptional regulator [Pseudomonas sp. S31]|uniref:transcriptional regulator n=1 Tax=Pseudomonas sp. S31 TaxID=1564473 RepID=UPI001912473E|nr:transcriptional regulator [Pseudomonas sp. S31]